MSKPIITVKVSREMDRDELWSNVFGTAGESWSWWRGIAYRDGATWESPGESGHVILRVEDPDNDGKVIEKRVGIDDVVCAAEWYVRSGYEKLAPLDDLDASASDVILQLMVFGEVVYG